MDIYRLIPLLRCPETGRQLEVENASWLRSVDGNRKYPVVGGVPVFSPEGGEVKIHPRSHMSNTVPKEAQEIIASHQGAVLNLSAGGTPDKAAHVVELEYSIFRNTDVVGDAHRLPFADGVFDAVICLNAFEHYRDPWKVASEVRRVLRDGGVFFMHTASLQPVHEPPHHYYNATRFGVAEWLKEFGDVDLRVSDNFVPAFALSWIASEIRIGLGTLRDGRVLKQYGRSRIDELADLWAKSDSREKSRLWRILQRLPEMTKESCAAGWQARAVKKAPDVSRNLPAARAPMEPPAPPEDDMVLPANHKDFELQPISVHLDTFPAMLGTEERKLPVYLAQSLAKSPGAMVELGCYLGGSTAALLEGASKGLGKIASEEVLVHSYDLFVANDYMVEHSLNEHGVKPGESFVHVFKKLLGKNAKHVDVHAGDIRKEVWTGGLIKLLYVDILWGWDINQWVFDQFYSSLQPGSYLVHQDYIYSCYPWLPISMEWLVQNGYFSFESFAKNSTVAFRCDKSPRGAVGSDFARDISSEEKRDLLKCAQRRFTGYPRDLLRLSEASLLYGEGDVEAARKIIADIRNNSTHTFSLHHCGLVEKSFVK